MVLHAVTCLEPIYRKGGIEILIFIINNNNSCEQFCIVLLRNATSYASCISWLLNTFIPSPCKDIHLLT